MHVHHIFVNMGSLGGSTVLGNLFLWYCLASKMRALVRSLVHVGSRRSPMK